MLLFHSQQMVVRRFHKFSYSTRTKAETDIRVISRSAVVKCSGLEQVDLRYKIYALLVTLHELPS